MHVTDEMVDLIREAIRFANWGAGQGLCPGAEEGISGPEDFLFEYSCKTGDEDWETLADRVSAALRAAPAAEPVAQCCMCGKTGLSTVEGDGGSECQLSDGRWTCSFECWERATERDVLFAPVADGWRPDAEKMREDCARWCETNGFSEAAPMLRKLPISRSRAAPTEAGR